MPPAEAVLHLTTGMTYAGVPSAPAAATALSRVQPAEVTVTGDAHAEAAGDTITSALEEMKSLAVNIASSTGSAQTAYLADYNALGLEVASAISGATFDGVNSLTALGSNAAITAVNTGSITAANATAANVDAAIAATTSALATLGTQSKSLGRQITFVNKLQDALEAGVGNLVDADLAKESAKLTALQTKQQLGVQALSIANQGSSILLSLFR